MFYSYVLLGVICTFLFLLGITVGHAIFVLQLRREENKKRELELALLDKRSQVLKESKKISHNLEELLYKANVQQEIENIIKKKDLG